MITVKEAYNIYKNRNPKSIVNGITETDADYIFITDDSGQGFDAINKKTKESHVIWWYDLSEKVDEGKVKDLPFPECIS